MNAVVRMLVLGLGAIVLSIGTGCAVGTISGHDEDGTSSSALTGAEQAAVEEDEASQPAFSSDTIHLPQRLTRPVVSAPGTENSKPADPSPWHDPQGAK